MNPKEIYREPMLREEEQKEIDTHEERAQETGTHFSSKVVITLGEKERIVRSQELAYTKKIGQSAEKFEQEDAGQQKSVDAKQVKNQILSLCNRLSEQDCKDLKEEGFMTLKKYRADQIDRAIDRVKEQRTFKEQRLTKQVDHLEEKRAEIENIAVHQISSDSERIIERLRKSNLPITDENVAKFADALSMMNAINNISPGQIATMVGQGTTPSVEAIYKASYSGSKMAIGKDSIFQEMQQEIGEMLQEEGFHEDTSMNTAKTLLEYEIPITKETVTAYEFIESLKQHNPEDIEHWLLKGMGEGEDPTKVDLSKKAKEDTLYEQAEQLVTRIEEFTEEDIDSALDVTENLTLQRLYWSHQGIVWTDGQTNMNQEQRETAKITAKRQLEEIRLKLTVENAYSMYKQGITIDTQQLSQVVEQLKAIEDAHYQNLFGQDGVILSSDQITLYETNHQIIEEVKNLPSVVLGIPYESQGMITLQEIAAIGHDVVLKKPWLVNEYEKVMTVPRKDLGDSIHKAFDSMDSMIEELQLENTEANKRAIRILAYNQMSINKESIEEMKAYYHEVSSVLEKLTPQVTMQLIKEGTNPIDKNLKELSQQIDEKKQQLGSTEEERFSEYLYQLDRKKEIGAQEREAYIGLYRLLHQVEKSDGAAVGSLVKSGQEVTLKNLLMAVRSQKASGMDITLDKETAEIAIDTSQQNSITNQIEQGFKGDEKSNQSVYQQSLASDLYETIHLDKWEEVASSYKREGKDLYSVSLEQLHEELYNTEASSEHLERPYLEEIRQVAQVPSEAIEVLVNSNLPLTIEHIISVNGIQGGTSSLYQQIQEIMKRSSGTIKDKVEQALSDLALYFDDEKVSQENRDILQEALGEVLEEQLQIEHAVTSVEPQQVEQLVLLHNQITLSGKLASKKYYQVPIKLGEEMLTVNVQLQSTDTKDSKVHIKTRSEDYGQIEISLSIQNQQVDGFILCEKRQVQEQMEAQSNLLKDELKELGFESKQIITTVNQKAKQVVYDKREESETKAATKELYEVAKIFLRAITNLCR